MHEYFIYDRVLLSYIKSKYIIERRCKYSSNVVLRLMGGEDFKNTKNSHFQKVLCKL